MSSGIEDFGKINLELLGFLFLAWVIVYFCIWKSVRTTGKVVFFTATFPYLLLLAFLVRGLTLPGAMDGINFFVKLQWDQMLESKVWIYAAAQVTNIYMHTYYYRNRYKNLSNTPSYLYWRIDKIYS